MKHRIRSQWNLFRTSVMPANAPPVQVQEMRQAFYAGVECALNRLAGEVSPGDSLDDPNDERMVLEVQQELREFARDVKDGTA